MAEKKRKHDDSKNDSLVNDQCNDEDDEELFLGDEEGGIRFEDIYIPPPCIPACLAEFSGPRLMITKIVNENFKSYANEVTIGPFHKCFNAIAGPNGSGKSNVIDSMLFVFGYRASKIRSKKLSVLLHNSETHNNVQSCTVAVHFQLIIDKEGDDYEVVPNSEFIVSRTAHKDNTSYYQLNGKRVQFKDVALLLRKYHIDLDHNRFLILQGEVEQIAMMKPKAANEHESGMLEYLEDIIGTTRFKVPLQKLFERLEIINEQRLEKLNRVKLVDKEKTELEGPMKEAVEFLKLENDVAYKKNILLQKQIIDMSKQNSELEKNQIEIEDSIKQFEENLKKLGEEKIAKEAVISEAAQKYNHLEKRKEELKSAFEKANNRDITLSEEMQQKNKRRKKNIELLKEERLNLEKLQSVPERNEASIADYMNREQEVTAEKAKLQEDKTTILASLQTETKSLRERKEVLQNKLIDLNRAVLETKSEYSLTERELKICLSSEENERNKLENLKEQFSKNESTIVGHTKAIKELKGKIPLTEKSISDAQKELQAVKQEEAVLIQELRKKRITIEETKTSMQATTSKNRVLDALMNEKRTGNCPGLFGRLGDLGAIDKKYDVAVSTACGPLDNIVVDTVTTAQWCIEFLKRHDIGRATFIALDRQEHLREIAAQPIKTPENVPRLYNLIRIEDERIAPAFYYALRDTLVANDLDQASRIAYGKQRFRVVTLRGDVIETAGTMSGGGKNVSRGRMGQQVAVKSNVASPEELKSMENDLQKVEMNINELRKNQISLEQQLNTLQPELQKMKIDLEKFSREVQSLKELKPKIEKQIKEQELKSKSTKADANQVTKLTKIVEIKKAAFEEADKNAQEVQVQVDEITKEIDSKMEGKIKVTDKKIKQASDTINKCKAEITKLKVAIKTSERNCKKSAELITTLEQEIKDSEDSLRAMKKEREEIESDGAALLKCLENVTKELNEGENDYSGEKKAVESLVKSINKMKGDKIEIDQKLKTVTKQLSEQKVQISQWKHKLTQLALQELPDEEIEPLREFTAEELDQFDIKRVQRELGAHTETLKTSKPNLNAIKNYLHKKEQYMTRLKELEELSEKRRLVRGKLDEWRKTRLEEFSQGFRIITMKLKEMYQMITMGGDAELELVDTFDPFNEGVTFNVRPPKKTWKNISNLSGGEKTLSSLALVFALHYYKPSPLYVMDEIDAALDFKNVSIVGNYIKERTKNAQFIIISLRSNMFELCDYLVGIYKTYNCTHSLTIDPRVYDKKRNEVAVESEENVQNEAGTENGIIEENGVQHLEIQDNSNEDLNHSQ